MLHQDCAGSSFGLASGLGPHVRLGELLLCRSWSVAVKRSSTRETAGGHWLKVDLHQAKSRKARRAVRLGIGQSRGCSFRESVAEVGEAHLFGQNGLRGNSRQKMTG